MSLIDLSDRLKPFDTVLNFRDFGGYAGRDGRPVRTGLLFRSAHLNGLNETDLAEIDQLEIGTIIDLRHPPERKRQPSKWPIMSDRATTLTQPNDSSDESVAPHEAFAEHQLYEAADARDYMINSYRTRPHEPGFKALFADTLVRMSDEQSGYAPSGVLVHCAAGKDRTGTLCALIQGLLGVSEDDIMADYMLTAEAVDIEAFLEPAAAVFSQRYSRPISADALRPMFGVEPDYIRASLDAMGNMARYAKDALGMSDNRIDRLRSYYLDG